MPHRRFNRVAKLIQRNAYGFGGDYRGKVSKLPFLGVVLDSVVSFLLALIVLNSQNLSAEKLTTKLKFSETVIGIVGDIGYCKKVLYF